jgi:hypothetical protein
VVEIEIQLEQSIVNQDITIYLVAIYDKSEIENISDKDLKSLIDEINAELDNEDNEK